MLNVPSKSTSNTYPYIELDLPIFIQSPFLISGALLMPDLINMTPKDRVFETLKNIANILEESEDLNKDRDKLIKSMNNAISWECQLDNITPK